MEKTTSIPSAFKRYDIRGRYPKEIDKDFAKKVGSSIGTWAKEAEESKSSKKKATIAIGMDTNPSSPIIKEALITGIRNNNTDVIDVGIGPTEMVAFAGKMLKATASVMITASHLGTEYTGFKFMYPDGTSFENPDLNKIKDIFLGEKWTKEEKADISEINAGHLTHNKQLYNEYMQTAKKVFQRYHKRIDAKVIIDTGAGATTQTTPILLDMLGAEVIKINCDPKDIENRHADCADEKNISYLKEEILKHNADIAIAHDMDGDRIAAFDRNGRWITGDQMFALFAKTLAKEKESIIASIDTSELLEKTAKEKNNKIIHTRVGDPFVLKALKESNANLAGEPNGHYALKEFIPYNSGTLFALFLAACAKDIPHIVDRFPKYSTVTRKYTIKDKESKLKEIETRVKKDPEAKIISTIDGIKYRTPDMTILLRPSGTEDALRVVLETQNDAEKILHTIEKNLRLTD